MSISYAETVPLSCPRCGRDFAGEIYILVDAVERPDLVERLLDDTLHDTRCPQCGQVGRVAAPLLYHDGLHARVLLGVPDGLPEAEWREVGQTLLWTLIGALPEAARLPYLGEVQAEAGLPGVAEVIRRDKLVGSGAEEANVPPIARAIQALLTAGSSDALLRVLDQHPILQEPQSITILQELASEARKSGEAEAAGGFERAAELLATVTRRRKETPIALHLPGQAAPAAPLVSALLGATTGAQLVELLDQHPALLDDAGDSELLAYAEAERLAGRGAAIAGLEERLAALRELRAQYRAQQPLLEAVEAYLQADSADAIETIVLEREELTTDAADQALERLADGARADGDADFARFVEERRRFLREVRSALEG